MKLSTLPAAALVAALAVAGMGTPAHAFGGDDPPPEGSDEAKTRQFIDKKDFAAAIPLLMATVAKSPDNADAWNMMGYAHRKLGLFAKAEGHYGKALAIDSAHRGALEYLGELYLETGRPERAKEMLKRLDDACLFGCEEYDELKAALTAAKAID